MMHTPSAIHLVDADKLRELAQLLLVAAGATSDNAEQVATALVSANLAGVDSHGVWYLPRYVSAIREGHLVPDAVPSVIEQSGTTCLISGNWCFGQVAALFTLQRAIELARVSSIAIAGLVQTHHLGRLGQYSEIAAAQGMISMIFASGYAEEIPVAVPYGGRKAVLHTNPLAIGIPINGQDPLILDYATTATTSFKVNQASAEGEPLKPGMIVDKDGRPTINPSDYLEGGAHLPFGEHKGYALMVAIEVLGRVLTGAARFADPQRGGSTFRHQGTSFVVVSANAFQPMAGFVSDALDLRHRIHNVPPAPGFSEVLLPGDIESHHRAVRAREGIPIANHVWVTIQQLAISLEVVHPLLSGYPTSLLNHL
ncbi:MAG: Ldh family oxidoreductase [Dehalococcoidia bacterium]